MTIRDKPVILDTNIWIFGLRRHPDLPACAQLLERLGQLEVILPRQLLQELRANLSESELKILFHLLKQFSEKIVIGRRPRLRLFTNTKVSVVNLVMQQ